MGLIELEANSKALERGRRELPKKIKILTAVVIFYTNVTFGCAFTSLNHVLTSMENKYETNDATISKVFTILTGCYMLGALCAGIIYNYVNRQLAVIIILSTMSIMSFLIPHCPTLTTFFLAAAVTGLCCGSYDTAQVVWMMEMMQKDCPPYVQGQHFFYGLGTILVGLIMAPFLDEKEEDITTTTKSLQIMNGTIFNEDESSSSSSDHDKLFIPYSIVGVFVLSAVVCHIFLFIFFRYFPPPPEVIEKEGDNDKEKSGNAEVKEKPLKPLIGQWSWPKLRIVLLGCCHFGAYQGMEMCTFQFLSKFGQNSKLDLTESQAAYVVTGMTAGYGVGRGIATIAVFKISSQILMCGNLVLVLIANILLIGWASSSLPMLWTSGILFGFGFSSMYASFSAFLERNLKFTNFIGSLMLVCGSGVAAIYPLVVGTFIEENPIVLSYTTFFSITLLTLAFATFSYLTYKDKTRY